MLFVKQVESNLKGGVQAELGPKTLIVGPNGSGKSAIVASLELSLSGAVSDVVGRGLVKEINQLLTLGPGDALSAKSVLSSGAVSVFRTEGKKGALGVPACIPTPSTVFPLRSVKEALSGSVETTRKFFLQYVAGSVTDEDILGKIPAPLQGRFHQLTKSLSLDAAPVDRLVQALAKAKDRLADVRSERKAADTIVQQSSQGREPPPSDARMAQAQADVIHLKKDVENGVTQIAELRGRVQALKLSRTELDPEKLRAQEAEAAETVRLLEEELATARAKIAAAPPAARADRTDELREHLLAIVRYAEEKKLGSCPTCGIAQNPGISTYDWSGRRAKVEAKIAERKMALAAGGVAALEAHLANVTHDLGVAQADLAGVRQKLAEATGASAAPGAWGELEVNEDAIPRMEKALEEVRKRLADAETKLRGLEAARSGWQNVKKARDLAAEKEQDEAAWTQLLDHLKRVVGEVLDAGKDAFVARVQQYLPREDRFGLELRDEDREVCRWGLYREHPEDYAGAAPEVLHTALSGAEWARLTAALACAAVPDGDEGLRIVVPDDRAWDPHTLFIVLEALAKAPFQVVVATTTMPLGELKGWAIIQTGGIEKTAPTPTPARVVAVVTPAPNPPEGYAASAPVPPLRSPATAAETPNTDGLKLDLRGVRTEELAPGFTAIPKKLEVVDETERKPAEPVKLTKCSVCDKKQWDGKKCLACGYRDESDLEYDDCSPAEKARRDKEAEQMVGDIERRRRAAAEKKSGDLAYKCSACPATAATKEELKAHECPGAKPKGKGGRKKKVTGSTETAPVPPVAPSADPKASPTVDDPRQTIIPGAPGSSALPIELE